MRTCSLLSNTTRKRKGVEFQRKKKKSQRYAQLLNNNKAGLSFSADTHQRLSDKENNNMTMKVSTGIRQLICIARCAFCRTHNNTRCSNCRHHCHHPRFCSPSLIKPE